MLRWRYWALSAIFCVVGCVMCFIAEANGYESLGRWSMDVHGIAKGCTICFILRMCEGD